MLGCGQLFSIKAISKFAGLNNQLTELTCLTFDAQNVE
jgi:hypothetical protein